MKVIGIVGSRRRNKSTDLRHVEEAFFKVYEDGDEIVSGGCRFGADSFAEYIARQHEIPIKIYYAKWKKLGKVAGFERNPLIARDAQVLIACVAPDRMGGTEDTIEHFGTKGELIIV